MPKITVTDQALITQIMKYCMHSTENYLYIPDILHENRPIMQALFSPKAFPLNAFELIFAAYRQRSQLTTPAPINKTPIVWIWKIEQIENVKFQADYQARAREIKREIQLRPNEFHQAPAHLKFKDTTLSGPFGAADAAMNEYYLFSGHKSPIIDEIANNGFRNDLSKYHSGFTPLKFKPKGFGALGRGSYFTDIFYKAATYSPCPCCGSILVCPTHCKVHDPIRDIDQIPTRRLLISKVLLGISRSTIAPDEFRHINNNDQVSSQSGSPTLINRMVTSGQTPPSTAPSAHSNIGLKTGQPGASLTTLFFDKKIFDSDEYCIANADQALPCYIIHFTVFPRLDQPQSARL
ncbi:hypothetical protein [Chromobacterium haemolyticum]|uniref:hypothetical protein n=1 Tax=Chromobacterium haemolyticum TaxID=394935 RepID=UPI0009D9E8E1|nr:hypothetical protein [Chromobacterium haemolyticum]OQS42879.1 hypothetical protein B0T39_04465 [Chromobacterium haemolyticum]